MLRKFEGRTIFDLTKVEMQYSINYKSLVCLLLISLGLVQCNSEKDAFKQSGESASFSAIVEVSAGTSGAFAYNPDKRRMEKDTSHRDNQISFLASPVNIGLIHKGIKGQPQRTLILSDAINRGDQIGIVPIGALLISEHDKTIPYIISIPSDPDKRIITADSFISLSIDYPGIKSILEQWMSYHKGIDALEVIGWKNEDYALSVLSKAPKE